MDMDEETLHSWALDFATNEEKTRLKERMEAACANQENKIADALGELAAKTRSGAIHPKELDHTLRHPFLAQIQHIVDVWSEAQYLREAARKLLPAEK